MCCWSLNFSGPWVSNFSTQSSFSFPCPPVLMGSKLEVSSLSSVVTCLGWCQRGQHCLGFCFSSRLYHLLALWSWARNLSRPQCLYLLTGGDRDSHGIRLLCKWWELLCHVLGTEEASVNVQPKWGDCQRSWWWRRGPQCTLTPTTQNFFSYLPLHPC